MTSPKVDGFYPAEEVGEEIKYGGKENMWKYLAALLVVLLSLGGLVTAETTDCADCYANVITQTDTQTVQDVKLGTATDIDDVAVGNEGLSAAIIVTKAPVEPTAVDMFIPAPFARIDQTMNQEVSTLGDNGEGAKGITWNKAIQAAWIANQGVKELETNEAGDLEYVKEGSYISQNTTQLTNNVYDYSLREGAKILNVDNKLAMIVDNMTAILDLSANADSSASSSESATGTIDDYVSIGITGTQEPPE
jgi:hypothetical protein